MAFAFSFNSVLEIHHSDSLKNKIYRCPMSRTSAACTEILSIVSIKIKEFCHATSFESLGLSNNDEDKNIKFQ